MIERLIRLSLAHVPYFNTFYKVAWVDKFSNSQTKATCLESDSESTRLLHVVFSRADSALRCTSHMVMVQEPSCLTMLSNMASTQIRFGGSLSAGVTSMPFG